MIRRAAVAALAAFALLARSAAAEPPFAGVTIGDSVETAARTLGAPLRVESLDIGNRFTFANAIAYVDDDASVLALDTSTGSVTIEVDGASHTLAIGSYTAAQADAQFSNEAEYASDTLRSFRLSPTRELVLFFDRTTQHLTRAIYGQRAPIARLGVLPGESIVKAVPFAAARLRSTAIAGTTGTQVTVVRLALDRGGNPTTITVVIPSNDPAWDAQLPQRMAADRFYAAKLGGRNIGSTVFRELRH